MPGCYAPLRGVVIGPPERLIGGTRPSQGTRPCIRVLCRCISLVPSPLRRLSIRSPRFAALAAICPGALPTTSLLPLGRAIDAKRNSRVVVGGRERRRARPRSPTHRRVAAGHEILACPADGHVSHRRTAIPRKAVPLVIKAPDRMGKRGRPCSVQRLLRGSHAFLCLAVVPVWVFDNIALLFGTRFGDTRWLTRASMFSSGIRPGSGGVGAANSSETPVTRLGHGTMTDYLSTFRARRVARSQHCRKNAVRAELAQGTHVSFVQTVRLPRFIRWFDIDEHRRHAGNYVAALRGCRL